VVGKGMIRVLKDDYPDSNIVAIDYDPGATKINQENRIKLMISNAGRSSAEEAAKADSVRTIGHHMEDNVCSISASSSSAAQAAERRHSH
jgi:predicted nucleotide-binding protein (sugar kinase/HSP70/actin superfamily)